MGCGLVKGRAPRVEPEGTEPTANAMLKAGSSDERGGKKKSKENPSDDGGGKKKPKDNPSDNGAGKKKTKAKPIQIYEPCLPTPKGIPYPFLDFWVRGKHGSEELSVDSELAQDDTVIPIRLLSKTRLSSEETCFKFYVCSVRIIHKKEQGSKESSCCMLDAKHGVKLCGKNILPTAVLPQSELVMTDPHRLGDKLREKGYLHWHGTYEFSACAVTSLEPGTPLLEFRAKKQKSKATPFMCVELILQDHLGNTQNVKLKRQVELGDKYKRFSFIVTKVGLKYGKNKNKDTEVIVNAESGVRLMGENVLPTAIKVCGKKSLDPKHLAVLRSGKLCWNGTYEMTPLALYDEVLSLGVELPTYWDEVELESGKSQRVQASPDVLKAVQALLEDTWKSTVTRDRGGAEDSVKTFSVVQVLRNENPSLWIPYWRQRERIRRSCGEVTPVTCDVATTESPAFAALVSQAGLCEDAGECYLFHGTNPTAANSICESDFRVDFAGSNKGTLYGKGIYFAENSSKSDEYATDDKTGLFQGLFCLLLCRVTRGKWLYTDEVRPKKSALRKRFQEGHYDSVLGDRVKARGTYREFVLYNNDQVYPEYIIIYRRDEAARHALPKISDTPIPDADVVDPEDPDADPECGDDEEEPDLVDEGDDGEELELVEESE